jgi:peptide/nickel transport system substrate-binding protein
MKTGKNWLVLTVSLLAILAGLYFSSPQVLAGAPQGVMKGVVHFGIAGDWLDPSITLANQSAYFTLYLFHDSLVKPMPNDMYYPSLAESWTISPDQKVYEFKLRKGVKFHNGDEMTAEDVVFTFHRYKGTSAKLIHDKTAKVEAVDPYLVRIIFKTPFPDFIDYLLPQMSAISWIVPKKYIEKVGDAEYKRHPIGCGPYKFVEFTPGVKLVGEAFEGYWRKVPNIKRLEFFPVEEISARFARVKRGEADFALSMVDVFYDTVKKDPNLRMVTINTPNHWILYVASQWDPKSPWSDPRVRKAASLALDRKALSDVVFPEGEKIGTIFLLGDPETVRYPPDPYDPERARKLLAEAGYPKGFQGGTFYPQGGSHAHMGEMIATFWKAVGINVDIVLFDRPGWLARRVGGKMKGAIFNDNVGHPTISARLSYLFGPQNYGNYPDLQALWDQHERSLDPNVRKDLRERMQRSIYDRTMFIPLVKSTTPSAFGPRVKGDPFKIREPYPVWWPCPMEDLELNE